jgi:hypothetical protein
VNQAEAPKHAALDPVDKAGRDEIPWLKEAAGAAG